MTDFLTVFNQGLTELGIDLTGEQKEQYLKYLDLLTEWNQKVNLTAIKEQREIAVKHFLDSLAAGVYFDWNNQGKMLDLGSGAGFPGLVLKIWQPDRQITLVDSVQKKVNFMKQVIDSLELEDAIPLHSRAEGLGRDGDHRQQYGLVTARAVAELGVLCEYCLPLLAVGGYFYALKGPNYEEELQAGEYAIKVLGGKLEAVKNYNLPVDGNQRTLIIIKKVRATPKEYPRKSGLPRKKPLSK